MRYLIPLVLILMILPHVLAPSISGCQVINSGGSYVLTNDVDCTNYGTDCISGMACILINTSSVTIDLDDYKIEDMGCGCPYGIANYGPTQSDIEVYDGEIRDFDAQVGIVQVDGGDYHDLDLFGSGDGVRFINPLNQHVTVRSNYIETQDYSIYGVCLDDCTFNDNQLNSFDGVFLNGAGFLVEGNTWGYGSDNSGDPSPCTRNEYYTDYSMTCDFCWDSIIRENTIFSDEGFRFINDAYDTVSMLNEFWSPSETFTLVSAWYDSSTYNNTFCYNRICNAYLNIVDGTCWFERNCENGAGYVDDDGVNNDIAPYCEEDCTPKWFCDGDDKVFITSDCEMTQRTACEYGCSNGQCVGEEGYVPPTTTLPTPTEEYNITWTQPILNATECQEAGLGWIIPFITPFFFAHMLMFIIAGAVAMFSKSPPMGGIVTVVFFVIYAFIGMYPTWIVIIMILLATGVVAMFGKRMVS